MSKKRTQFSKVKYQFISPFGPSVLIGKMPDVILDEFEKMAISPRVAEPNPNLDGSVFL